MYEKFQRLLDTTDKSVYQISKETGISQTAFSNWKSGRSAPSLESLVKLSKYFKVPIEYFIDDQATSLLDDGPEKEVREGDKV